MKLQVIAIAHNGFTDKFGIPRQSRETSSIETRIVFEPNFRDENMLRGIEDYSHLWLIWEFSQIGSRGVEGRGVGATGNRLQATVRPPRLGGNTRVGVFATRSPFRPNRLGLSSVELVRVEKTEQEGCVLVVRGADLLDGTPIYDIKPYLSYSDSHPDAKNGFGEETRDYKLKVESLKFKVSAPDGDSLKLTSCPIEEIEEILSQDPRPAYQDDRERIYKLDYAGWKVSFRVEGDTVHVVTLERNAT